MEPDPDPGAGRPGPEARVLVRLVVVVVVITLLAKCIVQLFRAWAPASARQCAERDVVAGHRAVLPCATAARGAPAEEDACGEAEEEDYARSAENPFLVRDEGGHIGEPAFVGSWYHRTRGSCARNSTGRRGLRRGGTSVVECGLVCLAFSFTVIAREMIGGLGMCLGRGARLIVSWLIETWEGGENFVE